MEHINIKTEINGKLSNGTGGGKYDNIYLLSHVTYRAVPYCTEPT